MPTMTGGRTATFRWKYIRRSDMELVIRFPTYISKAMFPIKIQKLQNVMELLHGVSLPEGATFYNSLTGGEGVNDSVLEIE